MALGAFARSTDGAVALRIDGALARWLDSSLALLVDSSLALVGSCNRWRFGSSIVVVVCGSFALQAIDY